MEHWTEVSFLSYTHALSYNHSCSSFDIPEELAGIFEWSLATYFGMLCAFSKKNYKLKWFTMINRLTKFNLDWFRFNIRVLYSIFVTENPFYRSCWFMIVVRNMSLVGLNVKMVNSSKFTNWQTSQFYYHFKHMIHFESQYVSINTAVSQVIPVTFNLERWMALFSSFLFIYWRKCEWQHTSI